MILALIKLCLPVTEIFFYIDCDGFINPLCRIVSRPPQRIFNGLGGRPAMADYGGAVDAKQRGTSVLVIIRSFFELPDCWFHQQVSDSSGGNTRYLLLQHLQDCLG